MRDRLRLDENRLHGIVDALRQIAEQKAPVGRILAEWDRPNGLHIQRVATRGGVAPAITCDAAGKGKREIVKYQADYIFWKAM